MSTFSKSPLGQKNSDLGSVLRKTTLIIGWLHTWMTFDIRKSSLQNLFGIFKEFGDAAFFYILV